MTLPCPGGQGGAAVCACDAVCPAGKSAAERRAGYGCIAEKAVPQALCASGGCRRAGEREALPPSLPRQRFPHAVPRGDRRALPAPAQGTNPLGIPFWGTGLIFPRLSIPQTPQAAGPCSWACRRLRPLPPRKKRKEAPMPPTRGAWARRPRAEGAGRPHCGHSRIFVTTPEPTVRPPSRMAKRRPSSHAIGVISVISMSMLSPGMTISTPSGSLMLPVTSVVRK